MTSNPITNNTEEQPSSNHHRSDLPAEERKRIHNYSCTLRQRKRSYRHKIVRRSIDRRFTITQIKKILRQHDISFSAVDKSKPLIAPEISLHIGIKEIDKMDEYQRKIKHLFTSNHYRSLHRNRRSTASSNHSSHATHHQQSYNRESNYSWNDYWSNDNSSKNVLCTFQMIV